MQELELLEEDAKVFKLIGPVLVQQETVEVKTNVTKRIEYIKSDIERIESNIAKMNKNQEKCKSQARPRSGARSSLARPSRSFGLAPSPPPAPRTAHTHARPATQIAALQKQAALN